MGKIRVIHQGLGKIGRGTARLVFGDPDFEIVGAVEKGRYIGNDLGNLLHLGRKPGIKVTDESEIEAVFKDTKPDIVVLTTSSKLSDIRHPIEAAAKHGINVVSSAEGLFYPKFFSDNSAEYFDSLAKERGIAISGTGVNPGCLMDTYPLQLFRDTKSKGSFDDFSSMVVYRHENTQKRREQLRNKTGVGLSVEGFNEKASSGEIGHSGLCMSAAYLADNLGLKHGYGIEFGRNPLTREGSSEVIGLQEICTVSDGDKEITLDLMLSLNAENKNCVKVTGTKHGRKQSTVFDYGPIVNGDLATCIILKAMIPYVVNAPPGLNTADYVPNPMELLKPID